MQVGLTVHINISKMKKTTFKCSFSLSETDTETVTEKFLDTEIGFSTHSVDQTPCRYIATFFQYPCRCRSQTVWMNHEQKQFVWYLQAFYGTMTTTQEAHNHLWNTLRFGWGTWYMKTASLTKNFLIGRPFVGHFFFNFLWELRHVVFWIRYHSHF